MTDLPDADETDAPIERLLHYLDLETLERNLYRGTGPSTGWQRVFGGQTIAQALVAAQRTVADKDGDEDRPVHSLHGYFLRPGDPSIPIVYEVDRIRDGGSFTTRRVNAIQHGKAIFSMIASFQLAQDGLDFQVTMPDVPAPEGLPSQQELADQHEGQVPESLTHWLRRPRPIELRMTSYEHFLSDKPLAPEQMCWLRATPADGFKLPVEGARAQRMQAALLAYASDMTLLDTALYPHGRKISDPSLQVASLDHAMWFHRDIDMNDWLLFAQDTPASAGGRGLTRGNLFTRDGVLVASCTQEGLIRPKLG
ncbi:acyl-CoA thioesterase II [Rhizobiaceae bacterium]|nr:acyl-CoA thioesterase II [Rhizobiaceae bacterium]